MTNITQKQLKEILVYNQETGVFVWKNSYRKRYKVAGSADLKGYLRIFIDGKFYTAHRLAWLYMMGVFPPEQVDHKNMIKSDNRWNNLRLADNAQNHMNSKMYKNNTTGYKGVCFHKGANKYTATIAAYGKSKYLGLYDTAELAYDAYCKAAEVMHGEYARTGQGGA